VQQEGNKEKGGTTGGSTMNCCFCDNIMNQRTGAREPTVCPSIHSLRRDRLRRLRMNDTSIVLQKIIHRNQDSLIVFAGDNRLPLLSVPDTIEQSTFCQSLFLASRFAMFRSSLLQAPVITLLSPSVSASRRAAGLLSSLLAPLPSTTRTSSSPNIADPDTSGDNLDKVFASSIPGFSCSWKSIGISCSVSGSVIHFCSLDGENRGSGSNNSNDSSLTTPFSLLSITDGVTGADDADNVTESQTIQSIQRSRDELATQFSQLSSATKHIRLSLKRLAGRPVTALDLLRETVSADGLPFMTLEDSMNSRDASTDHTTPYLKEIVVPFFDYAEYKDGSTMLSRLAMVDTTRPAVGVYRWPGSLTCIRPLPTAAEDQRLPPPSLIFHHESIQDEDTGTIADSGLQRARIGYSGGMNDGQIILLHADLRGLDVRLCTRTKVSSAFSEAQESLLAGSLDELQSTNVLLAGGEKAVDDDRIGKGDCWVELRANVKRPSGYLRTKKGGTVKQKIATIPDLPYE
jgi:hypothetical protein